MNELLTFKVYADFCLSPVGNKCCFLFVHLLVDSKLINFDQFNFIKNSNFLNFGNFKFQF